MVKKKKEIDLSINLENKYQLMSVSDLIPYARNARKHSEKQVTHLASLIKEFGFINPVIIDKDNGIIAGHGRILAAEKLNLQKVPTLRVEYLTKAQKKAYILADNQAPLEAEWDNDLLKLELDELDELGFNTDILGFEDFDFDEDESENESKGNEDEVPEVKPETPAVCKRGQIWELGNHRLMCGDSQNLSDLYALMNGKLADMVLTDPPYGINYNAKQTGRDRIRGGNCFREYRDIENDNIDDLQAFLSEIFKNITLISKPDFGGYIFYSDSKSIENITAILANKIRLGQILIWKKDNHNLSFFKYQYNHEPIMFIGNASNVKPNGIWNGGHQTTILEFAKDYSGIIHPTQKPIELLSELISHISNENDIVLDLFLGSGSALIASEKMKRCCYGIEIDPKYCDLIIERWEKYTGEKARLIN